MGAAVTFYQSGRMKKLRTFDQILAAETLNAVRRGTRHVRNEIHAEYIKTGIGRALFEGRGTRILGGSSLKTIIKQGRTKYIDKANGIIGTEVYVKGTAAMVAQGGKTKAHEITPSRMKFLQQRASSSTSVDAKKAMWRRINFESARGNSSFGLKGALSNKARGGSFFAIGTVKHPGSQFKRDDFMGRGSRRAYPRFKQEVERGAVNAANVVLNAGS